VVKAKGSGGSVGRPGEAVEKLLAEDRNISQILTVDTALKLEGEETGSIAEGVGAAIGGPGVERFKIEQLAADRTINLRAFVAKMSEKEAISEMAKAVRDQVEPMAERIRNILRSLPDGASVIVAGIGNTLGVA
jgi:hypothetical protein